MAKIIYENENGTQEVLREGEFAKSDVLVRPDFIAMKLWNDDDVASKLFEADIEPSRENVAAVINSGLLKYLDECTDGDWQIIKDAISANLEDGNIQKTPTTVKGICGIHEHIVKFCVAGNYCEYSFIAPGDDASNDSRKDLSACIEDTLHRLLDNGASEDDVRRELGAVQGETNEDDENVEYIDLGYAIMGRILNMWTA